LTGGASSLILVCLLGALYQAFTPKRAKALWDRFEFAYTTEMAIQIWILTAFSVMP